MKQHPSGEGTGIQLRIAYLILAHDQPNHFKRLVKILDTDSVDFFVHIDLKADISEFNSIDGCNIHFIENRLNINWGGYSLTQAMINLVREASKSHAFDYYIMLSGHDYPIKDNYYIQNFLKENSGTNFINFYPLVGEADLTARIKNYHFPDSLAKFPGRVRTLLRKFLSLINLMLPDRRFIEGMTPYRGSQWWCLNGQAVEYILEFMESPRGKSLTRFYIHTLASDEMLFQTVLLNSPHARQCRYYEEDIKKSKNLLKNENKAYLHYIDWDRAREDPAILDERDLHNLQATSFLFARKFNENRSAGLLDDIDKLLLKRNFPE